MKRLIFLFFNFWHYYCFTQPFDNLVLPNNNLYYFDYQSYPIRIINTNKTLRLFHTPPSYSCISRLNEVIFAVDGESILNKNFDIALNSDSLYGNIFTFKNKALSIREIKDTSKYLIFTPNSAVNIFKNGREGELYYSRFDLNLDNGLGGIHKEEKNLFLKKQILAKMTYTHSCDGTWLLVKEYSDKFLAFKIGRDGRVSNPVVSKDSINLVYNTNSFDITSSIGEMELSKDGSILANFYGDTLNYISLYKFDKITGIISGHNKILRFKTQMQLLRDT
jgi:hypothetical protein